MEFSISKNDLKSIDRIKAWESLVLSTGTKGSEHDCLTRIHQDKKEVHFVCVSFLLQIMHIDASCKLANVFV
jgi:hypothetical protein